MQLRLSRFTISIGKMKLRLNQDRCTICGVPTLMTTHHLIVLLAALCPWRNVFKRCYVQYCLELSYPLYQILFYEGGIVIWVPRDESHAFLPQGEGSRS